MNPPTPDQIRLFLRRLGERFAHPADFYLFGGSALLLLGGWRDTKGVDYTLIVGPEWDAECREAIRALGEEMALDLKESLPARYMPLPAGYLDRHQPVGDYGQVKAYLFDRYSMALMKLDRATPTDVADVHFLIHQGHIDLRLLDGFVAEVGARYTDGEKLRRNFEEMKRALQAAG